MSSLDQGTYTCQASNIAGTVSAATDIIIKESGEHLINEMYN